MFIYNLRCQVYIFRRTGVVENVLCPNNYYSIPYFLNMIFAWFTTPRDYDGRISNRNLSNTTKPIFLDSRLQEVTMGAICMYYFETMSAEDVFLRIQILFLVQKPLNGNLLEKWIKKYWLGHIRQVAICTLDMALTYQVSLLETK